MKNNIHMVNVGEKPIRARLAIACGEISVKQEAFELIQKNLLPKGNVLMLAEIAGIMGAKKAHELIPLCHPLNLDQVEIFTELKQETYSVLVTCFVHTHAKTGVEMEALAGVNAALLSIWDLTKMIEPELNIANIRLLLKKGGKRGLWIHNQGVPDWILKKINPIPSPVLHGIKTVIITLSDRAHKGEYADLSGELLHSICTEHGATIIDRQIIPDDKETLSQNIIDLMSRKKPDLIICAGGTGVSPRDITPETVQHLFDKTIPGVGELLRHDGAQYTPYSWSSRSIAGIIDTTLVLTLPGNPNAIAEGMHILLPKLLPHLIKTIRNQTT